MRVINKNNKIRFSELKEIAKNMFDNLVKAVVDVEKEIMVIGGELHTDEEALLLEMVQNKKIYGALIFIQRRKKKNLLSLIQ